MLEVKSLGRTTKLLASVLIVGGASTANAGWWSVRQPAQRTTFYQAQPFVAYQGAAPVQMAAVATPAACQACRPATCGTTVQRVCSYVPQTTFQVAYRDVPVTSFHPVTTVDHCTGCTFTSFRPVTTCTRQAFYVPQTTYRPVCTNVAISTAPAVACFAPQVAMAAPAASTCCPSTAATVAPATVAPSVPTMPSTPAPSGSGIPAPAIEPTEAVPNASGQSILNETQTRSPAPAQVQPTQGWKFGGPAPTEAAPRDRTALNADSTAMYRPVNLSRPAIQPAGSQAPTKDEWHAVK